MTTPTVSPPLATIVQPAPSTTAHPNDNDNVATPRQAPCTCCFGPHCLDSDRSPPLTLNSHRFLCMLPLRMSPLCMSPLCMLPLHMSPLCMSTLCTLCLEVQSQDWKKTKTEPDPDCWRPEIPRTVKDCNHGLVFGLSWFQKFQDWQKTGWTSLNQSFYPKTLPNYKLHPSNIHVTFLHHCSRLK